MSKMKLESLLLVLYSSGTRKRTDVKELCLRKTTQAGFLSSVLDVSNCQVMDFVVVFLMLF